MNMNKYYLEFKTWKEGMVSIPGPLKVLGETNEYRSRSDLNNQISENALKNTFLSFNESAVDKFLNENVSACVVAMIIEASSEQHAIDLANEYLGPIDLDGVTEINQDNENFIKEIMGEVVNNYPPQSLDS